MGFLLYISRIVLLAVAFVGSSGLWGTEARQHRWHDVSRIVAFADVHGAYDELKALLKKTGVIDEQLRWTGGTTHLVSLGDLLDRGGQSREVLELLMRLEEEADLKGGRVHVVLGNHEIMNLTGDLRYVSVAEYNAFANEENAEVRLSAFARYKSRKQDELAAASHSVPAVKIESTDREEALTNNFAKRFPPGFFAHRRAFGLRGRYGQWLLNKPQVLVINETVFVHGGLSPVVAGFNLEEMSQHYGGKLLELMKIKQDLLEETCIQEEQDLSEAVVSALSSDCESEVSGRFAELAQGSLFAQLSPTWFRGGALCHELLEEQNLTRVLTSLGSQRVIVGHSPTANHLVQQRFSGRLIRLDTGMLRSHYRGQPSAIVIEDDVLTVVYLHDSAPLVENPNSPAGKEIVLRKGTIESIVPSNLVPSNNQGTIRVTPETGIRGGEAVRVTWQGEEIAARFVALKSRDINLEVAAYTLDRLLDLGLVPVTVPRDHQGENGVLITFPDTMVTEAERVERNLSRPNWCGIGNVFQLMYVFDGLIRNEGRNIGSMGYGIPDWRLHITSHGQAFGRSGRLPAYLQQVEPIIPEGLAIRLAKLTDEKLNSSLEDLLSKSQINGLIKRRDFLLDNWRKAG